MTQYSLVEIRLDKPGFENFMGSRVIQSDLNMIIDVGPASTASKFVEDLKALGLDRIDLILLTHIHLDHAGGLAEVLKNYPEAKVVCHEKAVKFMADPSKLWEGSLKVLGDMARAYGRPDPIPSEKLVSRQDADFKGLKIIPTPGHAVHHLSFVYENRLFAGEAGGNLFTVNNKPYLRPATPPRFFLPETIGSVERLLELPDMPIYYAHYGEAAGSHEMLRRFIDQLKRWHGIIIDIYKKRSDEDLVENCLEALIEQDHEIEDFKLMSPDVQARERMFMRNSIRGYLGYIKENS